MSKSGRIIIALVIVFIIAGGAFVIANRKSDKDKNSGATSQTNQTSASNKPSTGGNDNGNLATDVSIKYDGKGFTVSSNTIAAGGKVTVTNNSDSDLVFDSDPHPVHTDNPELNAGDIPAGQGKTFTLSTKGTWGFHNHLNSSQHGELTVK